jgi:hypothetical protein
MLPQLTPKIRLNALVPLGQRERRLLARACTTGPRQGRRWRGWGGWTSAVSEEDAGDQGRAEPAWPKADGSDAGEEGSTSEQNWCGRSGRKQGWSALWVGLRGRGRKGAAWSIAASCRRTHWLSWRRTMRKEEEAHDCMTSKSYIKQG